MTLLQNIGAAFSFLAFILGLVLLWSVVSVANSNVRMRKAVEKIYSEINKANKINGVHKKWEEMKAQEKIENERIQQERKEAKKNRKS
ncbi:MAG TPA: hypothetical protein DDY13_07230 [Cytophagales bacterium]|jgi:predicted Holliday junction resolvase-like endonuclease|nr:hypothetical protein [Cytophagales bacterium]